MSANTSIAGYSATATASTGVNENNKIKFGVCTDGRSSSDTASTVETTVVSDAESISISFDNGIEEWNSMDQQGWVRRLMTSKSISFAMGGKRNYGDTGNDYVAGLAYKNGQDCNSWFSVIFPNLDQLIVPVVISVTSDGGESTAAQSLEWEAQSDGKPTYIAHSAA